MEGLEKLPLSRFILLNQEATRMGKNNNLILFLSRITFHETSLNASHFECGRCLELAQHHHESLCCFFLVFRSTFIPDGARGVFVVSCSCHPLTPLPVCLRVVCMRVRVCDLSVPHCCCCYNIPQHLSIFRARDAFTHDRT